MYTIEVTALTRRVCHRPGRIGSAVIRRRVHRCVLMGSWWLSVAMTRQFERLWRGLVWEWPSQPLLCATSVERSNLAFIWYSNVKKCCHPCHPCCHPCHPCHPCCRPCLPCYQPCPTHHDHPAHPAVSPTEAPRPQVQTGALLPG